MAGTHGGDGCSSVDDDGAAVLVREAPPQARACVKCKTADVTEVFRQPYCSVCFDAHVVQKFRASIGVSRQLQASDRVAVACSGGPSSLALLELVRELKEANSTSKWRQQLHVHVLHIDDCNGAQVEGVRKAADAYGWPLDVRPTAAALDDDVDVIAVDSSGGVARTMPPNEPVQLRLERTLNAFTSATARSDYERLLRTQLLLRAARDNGCRLLLTGECTNRVAANVLSLVAKGRGGTLADEVGAVDKRFESQGVVIMRPLRDLWDREIVAFNALRKIDIMPVAADKAAAPPSTAAKQSIDQLTDVFLGGLERDFPSTVDVVLRTADKVLPSTGDSVSLCELCGSARLPNAVSWRRNIVVRSDAANTDKADCGNGCGTDGCSSGGCHRTLNLCYACLTIVAETSAPIAVANSAQSSRAIQRAQIADFLLEDDGDGAQ